MEGTALGKIESILTFLVFLLIGWIGLRSEIGGDRNLTLSVVCALRRDILTNYLTTILYPFLWEAKRPPEKFSETS